MRPEFDEGEIQVQGFAGVELVRSLIRGDRIVQVAGGQHETAAEIVVKLGVTGKAQPKPKTIAHLRLVGGTAEKGLVAQPDISTEREWPDVFDPFRERFLRRFEIGSHGAYSLIQLILLGDWNDSLSRLRDAASRLRAACVGRPEL